MEIMLEFSLHNVHIYAPRYIYVDIYTRILSEIRTAETTAIRRNAVRETGVSWTLHLRTPPETPRTITPLYRFEGL